MNKIIDLFDYGQKLKFLILIFFMIIASFLELMGLGMVIIILNSFLGLANNYLNILNEYIEYFFKTEVNYELILFIIFILFTIKFVILVLVSWMESDFLAKFREKISNKLYNNFLKRDVGNLLKKNSAEYIRNFTEEIVASGLFVQSILKLILDSILILTFFIFFVFRNSLFCIS